MVKRVVSLIVCMALAAACSCVPVSADSPDMIRIENSNTTVRNELPEVRIYCETTEEYSTEEISVEIDGYPADVTKAGAFGELEEGMNYYMLVDVSCSVKEDDFSRIQKAIIGFGKHSLSEKDKVFLVPFGEQVYTDYGSEYYNPTKQEFEKDVNALRAEDDYTNLYDAIDSVASEIDSRDAGKMERNAVLLFTDGMDDTSGGYKNADEAPEALKEQGTPLYAFVTGGSKKSKDTLGELSRKLNGRLYTGDISANLKSLKAGIDNTLTVEAEANNGADLGAEFDVTVGIQGVDKSINKTVVANKNGELKNSLRYSVTDFIASYWWVVVIMAMAVIAAVVLIVIRKNKDVVVVDGQTVYCENLTHKQHIRVKKCSVILLNLRISVAGSKVLTRDVEMVNSLIVGRSDICDLYFDDPTMARQNFCIEHIEGKLFIRDLGSTNGTMLNGVRIVAAQELHRGDVITAGKTKIVVNW